MPLVPFKNTYSWCCLAILLPIAGMAQEKRGVSKSPWSYSQVEKATQIPLVQELMLDSIQHRLGQLALFEPALLQAGKKDSTGRTLQGLDQVKKNLQSFQVATAQQPFSLSGLSGLYALKEKGVAFTKKPVQLSVIEAGSTTVYDNKTLSDQRFLSQSSLGVTTNVGGLPFTYKVVNNYPAFADERMHPLFKVAFEQQAVLKNLQSQLTSQFNVEKLLLKDLDFKSLFRQYAEKKLSALKEAFSAKAGEAKGLLNGLESLQVEEFLYLTKEQLQERIRNSRFTDSVEQAKASYQSLLAIAPTDGEKDSLQSKIAAADQSLTSVHTLVEQLMAAKATFETKGLDYNQLVRYQQQVNTGVTTITSAPSFTQEAAKKWLKPGGLTRLFMHIQELNIGQFSSHWSDRSISNVLTSGIGGSYLNKNKFLGVTVANTQPLGWLKDQAFTGSMAEPAMRFQALRLGKGELTSPHSHFTLVNAATRSASLARTAIPALSRNIVIGSFSKQLDWGKYGKLEAEVAKSNTQYQHSSNAADELQSKIALSQFGADFFQTLSVGLQYQNRFTKASLEPQVFFNYAGLGYNNPVSAIQARGSKQYGFQVQKSLLAKKMTVMTRFSKRVNKLTVMDNRTMQQVQSSIAARYRISKKWRVGANWTYAGLAKEEEERKHTLFTSHRWNAEAMHTGRLFNKPVYQYISSGYQQIATPDLVTGISGKMLWVNTSATMAFTKGSLSTNMQWYNSIAGQSAQTDLLTADAGWSFTLFKRLSSNTSLTYLNQESIAQQVGVKQTLSASLKENIALSLYTDIRHNLVDNKNSFLFPATRGEVTLTYQLK